ncbi:MAG: Mu-like prophage major head subunit gpT family protein [Pseudomonadota bacterium]
MAIATPAFITALFTQFRRDFEASYAAMAAASFWMDVASEVPSTSASNTYGWLEDFPNMVEWVGARTIKDMKAEGYQITNKTWESTVGVKREDIDDDNLGIYRPMVQHMGQAAARHPDQLTASLMNSADATLCYDGQNFFDTDHPVAANHDGTGASTSVSNIFEPATTVGPKWFLLDTTKVLRPFIVQMRKRPEFVTKTSQQQSDDVFVNNRYLFGADGRWNVGCGFWQLALQSQATLNEDNFFAACTQMEEIQADGGRPMGVMPNLLVVPPALKATAYRTIKTALGDGGKSNPLYDMVDVKVVPWLA